MRAVSVQKYLDMRRTESLAQSHPGLLPEWDYTKNAPQGLDPKMLTAGSGRVVSWCCSKGHQWDAVIVNRTAHKSGCPFCSGRRALPETCLATQFPEVAIEWHPTRNKPLSSTDVTGGSSRKVWWRCQRGHEYQATPHARTARGSRCPYCTGKRASPENNLVFKFPDIAAQWHPEKNGTIAPSDVVAGSHRLAWWLCERGHEWQVAVDGRTSRNTGCPYCSNQRINSENSLASVSPDIASQWHPTKNGALGASDVAAGSNKKAWWLCRNGHEWQAVIHKRTSSGQGCPFCSNKRVSADNSLATLFPQVAAEWHPVNNGSVTPSDVIGGSHINAWWLCSQGHEWDAPVEKRTKAGHGCPYCSGHRASEVNNLAIRFPDIASEWHPTRNRNTAATDVVAGSNSKAWWLCGRGHEWYAKIANRTALGRGCPYCANQRPTQANNLASLFPDIAAEWHSRMNGTLKASDVLAGSGKKGWWVCQEGHEWQASIVDRVTRGDGCPICSRRWTLPKIRHFLLGLADHLSALTPAELYVIFLQNGALGSKGVGARLIRALVTGRLPGAEVEKFARGETSAVDALIENGDEDIDLTAEIDNIATSISAPESHGKRADNLGALPLVDTTSALQAVDAGARACADEEAVEFLCAAAVAKIWKHAFVNEAAAVAEAKAFQGSAYANGVRDIFLNDYGRATSLVIPAGYAFAVQGRPTPPNLMQRQVAARIQQDHAIGNWSGTGAGKTLSAILSTRVVDAALTIITCPNSVVNGWQEAIKEAFPQSEVATKTWTPVWSLNSTAPRYLVLNYEMFQQSGSAASINAFLEAEQPEFVIIDEIHYAKQRYVEDVSRRKQIIQAMLSTVREVNPDLYVLGLSATPIINNLEEGKSLLELITGRRYDDLNTRETVANCLRLHQQLMLLGIRWMPNYDVEFQQTNIEVDCSAFLDEIRHLGKSNPLRLEQILTSARIPTILDNITAGEKVVIYTHYIDGIDTVLQEALEAAGHTVGFFSGGNKAGLSDFLEGRANVLVGTSAIGTGLDGLQHVCQKLIVNVLPWTAAEFEQLKGRIYRQGQTGKVELIIPETYAIVNGERWSWCASKIDRLVFKRSIADAVTDGVVPDGHLQSPAQAYKALMAWLNRLGTGEIVEVERPRIVVPLPADDPADVVRRQARYGDFSLMNHRWNVSKSATTHERLLQDPTEWMQYHTLYREARKKWLVVPYEELVKWFAVRSGYVIGDFGCGEALLAEALKDRHIVHSFDHISVNDEVITCDMANVPIEDGILDHAVFSLSLMGANFADYIREAHRTLKLDGKLHIWESASRFTDNKPDRLVAGLRELGFDVGLAEIRDKWVHVRAEKTERNSHLSELRL